jgi:hypothetical protein
MYCKKFERTINFAPTEKCKGFSKSCRGCKQPHTDVKAEIDAMVKSHIYMPLRERAQKWVEKN